MQNEIKKIKGFEFNRYVETKFGKLPMVATVTFTKASKVAKAELSRTTRIEMRMYILGFGKAAVCGSCYLNTDMNDDEKLYTIANHLVTKDQKANVERVAVDMYIRNESDFWTLFEDEDLPEPDMSEYAKDKEKYFESILFDMKWDSI